MVDELLQKLIAAIKRYAPSLNPIPTKVGQISQDIGMYKVDCGQGIIFYLEQNLSFIRNGVVAETLLNVPIGRSADIDEFVRKCIESLSTPLNKAPLINDIARKYLGKEDEFKRNAAETQAWLKYPKFEIFVSADTVSLIGRKNRGVIMSKKFKNQKELENAFKIANAYVKAIEQGQLDR